MLNPRLTRGIEVLLALTALAVALAAAYTVYASIRETSDGGRLALTSIGYIVLVLEGTVIILGLRLAFVRFRPKGRVIGPTGLAGYTFLCATLFLLAWWRDSRFPPQTWPFLGGAIIGLAAFLTRRRED